jgi:16S rRNA (guanine527-N7)-methyltransferase
VQHDPELRDKLDRYRGLVERYASALDLSSPAVVRSFDAAIERSFAYGEHLRGARVLDLGSGVGLPGVVLAAARPELEFTLCEVRRRRAAFLERVVAELKLTNTRVYNADVRQYRGPQYGTVTSQAVGTLLETYRLCAPLLAPDWTILSRKGERAQAEADELRARVPGVKVELHPIDESAYLVVARAAS